MMQGFLRHVAVIVTCITVPVLTVSQQGFKVVCIGAVRCCHPVCCAQCVLQDGARLVILILKLLCVWGGGGRHV